MTQRTHAPKTSPGPRDVQAAALAAALEAMTTGHARILATALREILESAAHGSPR